MALNHNQWAVVAITATLCLAGMYTIVGSALETLESAGFEGANDDIIAPEDETQKAGQDTDGDGLLDKDDDCPSEAGSVANNGCPEIYPSDEALAQLVDYSRTINFAFDSAKFTDGTPPVLDAIVEILMAYPKANFSVEGHCDSMFHVNTYRWDFDHIAALVRMLL